MFTGIYLYTQFTILANSNGLAPPLWSSLPELERRTWDNLAEILNTTSNE